MAETALCLLVHTPRIRLAGTSDSNGVDHPASNIHNVLATHGIYDSCTWPRLAVAVTKRAIVSSSPAEHVTSTASGWVKVLSRCLYRSFDRFICRLKGERLFERGDCISFPTQPF
jgi:hypothetical protein